MCKEALRVDSRIGYAGKPMLAGLFYMLENFLISVFPNS